MIICFTAVIIVLVTDMVVLLTKGDQKYNLACLQDRKVHLHVNLKSVFFFKYILIANCDCLHVLICTLCAVSYQIY